MRESAFPEAAPAGRDTLVARRGGALRGRARLPGDKSISHRILLVGALADGETRVENLSTALDVARTLACLVDLGVTVERTSATTAIIHGLGRSGLAGPPVSLDCGDSGTTMRLLAGVLAGQERAFVLDGAPGLRRRPMARIVDPLVAMGADLAATAGRPPIRGHGAALTAGDVQLTWASAQVGSAVLLAGLSASGTTVVRYPAPVRDHTERLLAASGAPISWTPAQTRLDGPVASLAPPGGGRFAVPGDLSAAAYPLAAAAIVPGSAVELQGVGLNPGRTGLLDVLRRMGANLEVSDLTRTAAGEPVGSVTLSHAPLHATEVEGAEVPRLIDELPLVAVLATQAEGRTVVRGAAELRVKESDRIAAIAAGLSGLGARIEPRPDGFVVEGPTRLRGAEIDGHDDHRIVMALAVAGLVADGETLVAGARRAADSYPGFAAALAALGAAVEAQP